MKIEKIDVYHVAMPLIEPWKTAFSDERTIDSVLVRIRSGDSEGWGEAAPYAVPQFSTEWAGGCFQLIRDVFSPLLVGREIESGEALQAQLAPFKGNFFAKAAIDTAWWDLDARQKELPLWKLIGGTNPTIDVGADIPVQDDPEKLLRAVGAAVASGFSRTKLKFRRDSGVEMVAGVREAYPDAVIHIDCNSGFTLEDLPLFQELDKLGLAMIEQPLASDDLVDHSTMQARLETPICLDESITSLDRARKAIEIGAARWINIKHGRVGGLTNALKVHRHCVERGTPCWIGGMLESFVGQGPSIALSTLPGISYAADIFPEGRLYQRDLSGPAVRLSGPGQVEAPDRPGHGFRPDSQQLLECLVVAG